MLLNFSALEIDEIEWAKGTEFKIPITFDLRTYLFEETLVLQIEAMIQHYCTKAHIGKDKFNEKKKKKRTDLSFVACAHFYSNVLFDSHSRCWFFFCSFAIRV